MSEIRIEQYGPAGTDGRDALAMPSLAMTADALVLAVSAAAGAMAGTLDSKTRTLGLRCEGTGARVAVGLVQATSQGAAESGFTHLKGMSLNEGEVRFFAIPEAMWGKDNLRLVAIDRAAVL